MFHGTIIIMNLITKKKLETQEENKYHQTKIRMISSRGGITNPELLHTLF
jgi:hypothetical protein